MDTEKTAGGVAIESTPLLAADALLLCWAIEELPASTQQTDISCMASALQARCKKTEDAIHKAIAFLTPPLNGPAIQARAALVALTANNKVSGPEPAAKGTP